MLFSVYSAFIHVLPSIVPSQNLRKLYFYLTDNQMVSSDVVGWLLCMGWARGQPELGKVWFEYSLPVYLLWFLCPVSVSLIINGTKDERRSEQPSSAYCITVEHNYVTVEVGLFKEWINTKNYWK